jgi:hypothetical protein
MGKKKTLGVEVGRKQRQGARSADVVSRPQVKIGGSLKHLPGYPLDK